LNRISLKGKSVSDSKGRRMNMNTNTRNNNSYGFEDAGRSTQVTTTTSEIEEQRNLVTVSIKTHKPILKNLLTEYSSSLCRNTHTLLAVFTLAFTALLTYSSAVFEDRFGIPGSGELLDKIVFALVIFSFIWLAILAISVFKNRKRRSIDDIIEEIKKSSDVTISKEKQTREAKPDDPRAEVSRPVQNAETH